jgi:hypothetical protein
VSQHSNKSKDNGSLYNPRANLAVVRLLVGDLPGFVNNLTDYMMMRKQKGSAFITLRSVYLASQKAGFSEKQIELYWTLLHKGGVVEGNEITGYRLAAFDQIQSIGQGWQTYQNLIQNSPKFDQSNQDVYSASVSSITLITSVPSVPSRNFEIEVDDLFEEEDFNYELNSNSCESNLSPEYSIKETKSNHPGSPLVSSVSIPSVDQIRRSWESNSIPLDSFSPQKDRLPLLRDLMSTLNSFGYKENDLPRSFPEQVTSHWWSKAKKKDQRESMKQNSLTDYDRALVIFQEEIKIVSAKPIESPKEVIHQPTQSNKTLKKTPNRSVEAKLEATDKCLSYTDFDELDTLQRRNLAFKMDLDENDPIITKIMEDQYK